MRLCVYVRNSDIPVLLKSRVPISLLAFALGEKKKGIQEDSSANNVLFVDVDGNYMDVFPL